MKNTNARFVQDINRIVKLKQGKEFSLEQIQSEPIVSGRGIGNKKELKPASVSTGIASPLKEVEGKREYYEPELLTSSDGLFTMERRSIKKMVFEDNNRNEVVLIFENE